jgi:hypothetical protein
MLETTRPPTRPAAADPIPHGLPANSGPPTSTRLLSIRLGPLWPPWRCSPWPSTPARRGMRSFSVRSSTTLPAWGGVCFP